MSYQTSYTTKQGSNLIIKFTINEPDRDAGIPYHTLDDWHIIESDGDKVSKATDKLMFALLPFDDKEAIEEACMNEFSNGE